MLSILVGFFVWHAQCRLGKTLARSDHHQKWKHQIYNKCNLVLFDYVSGFLEFLAKQTNHNGVITMATDLHNEVFSNARADRGIEEHFHEFNLQSVGPMKRDRVNFIVFIEKNFLRSVTRNSSFPVTRVSVPSFRSFQTRPCSLWIL